MSCFLKLIFMPNKTYLSQILSSINFNNGIYRFHTGIELIRTDSQAGETLKLLWHYSDAIMCCSLKVNILIRTDSQLMFLIMKGFKLHAGFSFVHLRQPSWTRPAWNHSGCSPRHFTGEDTRRHWQKGAVLRVP